MCAERAVPRGGGGIRAFLAILGLVLVVTLGACASTATPSGTPTKTAPHDSKLFRLDFDGPSLLASQPAGDALVSERTASGGSLVVVDGPTGGRAVRFPGFQPGADAPRVGLVVTASNVPLPNPRTAEFSFGADVRLDETGSQSVSTSDDGDNIFQRGLASDDAEFKLQADLGRPSCAVNGSRGRLLVKGEELEVGVWYRLRCDLSDDGLRLTVHDLADGMTSEFHAPGVAGVVDFPPDVPMGIGHKIARNGALIKSRPDQFNGTMDSVWVQVGKTHDSD